MKSLSLLLLTSAALAADAPAPRPIAELVRLKLENTQMRIQLITERANATLKPLYDQAEGLRLEACKAAGVAPERCDVNLDAGTVSEKKAPDAKK